MSKRMSGRFGWLRIPVCVLAVFLALPALDLSAEKKGQEKRVDELEMKLKSLTDEVQKLKSEGIPEDRLKAVEEKISILAEEIENIKSAAVVEEPTYQQVFGRAPAASKVYLKERGLSIGGYGEVAVAQIRENDSNIVDAQRVILYVGYKYNDRIIFNSEVEFEHGFTDENLDGQAGEVEVEFATLDFLITDYFNLRGGLVLAPFGIINEVHEPTTFFGVFRPDVERQIIPTTWRGNGAGFFGQLSGFLPGTLNYRAYIMESLDSRGFRGVNNRNARASGNRARIDDIAFVSRVEYDPMPGLKFGGSLFIGNTGQNESAGGDEISGLFQMYEADVQLQWRGLEARALLVYTFLDDADLINLNNGFMGADSVGDEQFGWYVEAGYNLLSLADLGEYFRYFAPFVRYENLDTQKSVPSGFASNPANDRQNVTFGFSYKPIPQVVIKADYQWRDNEADSANNQFNLGLGYVF